MSRFASCASRICHSLLVRPLAQEIAQQNRVTVESILPSFFARLLRSMGRRLRVKTHPQDICCPSFFVCLFDPQLPPCTAPQGHTTGDHDPPMNRLCAFTKPHVLTVTIQWQYSDNTVTIQWPLEITIVTIHLNNKSRGFQRIIFLLFEYIVTMVISNGHCKVTVLSLYCHCIVTVKTWAFYNIHNRSLNRNSAPSLPLGFLCVLGKYTCSKTPLSCDRNIITYNWILTGQSLSDASNNIPHARGQNHHHQNRIMRQEQLDTDWPVSI